MMHLLQTLTAGLLLVAVASTATPSRSYGGYRLVHVVPRDAGDAREVQALSGWSGVDMWNRRALPGVEATVMVAPGAPLHRVVEHLDRVGAPYRLSQDDVQSLVEREAREQTSARLRAAPSARSGVRFDVFMRHEEIQQYLKELEAKNPATVSLQTIGRSEEGRDMTVIRVSRVGGKAPRAILVDAGIHAREWIAPATALYLINRLVEHADEHKDLLAGLDWYILPVVNPDGYEYTHTTDRFWRKNRGAKRTGWFSWALNLMCEHGADLNRNFGFHWGQKGTSGFPCSETFRGSSAFSEVESQHLRDFILAQNADKRFKMYLTLHSYGPMILYPWGYDDGLAAADDVEELAAFAKEANAAMMAAGSEPFIVKNSADLYPAAGASDDWAKGVGGIEKSYTIELHGGGSAGFDIPAKRIETSVKQVFEGLKVFGRHAQLL